MSGGSIHGHSPMAESCAQDDYLQDPIKNAKRLSDCSPEFQQQEMTRMSNTMASCMMSHCGMQNPFMSMMRNPFMGMQQQHHHHHHPSMMMMGGW